MTITFDQSVVKIRKDGVQVLSNTLEKGEKLADGETYAEAKKRLADSSVGIYIQPDSGEAAPGLTTDPTGVSTIPVELKDEFQKQLDNPAVIEDTTGDAAQTLTENADQTGSTPASEIEEEDDDASDDEKDDSPEHDGDDKTGVRPDDDAAKPVWFEYAQGKGHKGEYEDITKKQLIEQYGD